MMMATEVLWKLLHKINIKKFFKRFSLRCESFAFVSFTIFEKLLLKSDTLVCPLCTYRMYRIYQNSKISELLFGIKVLCSEIIQTRFYIRIGQGRAMRIFNQLSPLSCTLSSKQVAAEQLSDCILSVPGTFKSF